MYKLLILLLEYYLKVKGIFNPKIRKWNKDRNLQIKQLRSNFEIPIHEKVIWIHCASLGEYQQVAYLVSLLKKKSEKLKILITFFSPSGFENVRNQNLDYIYYFPLDNSSHIRLFINTFQPVLFVGVKYEWWWNLFEELNLFNIPKLLIAVKLEKTHYIFKWFSGRFRKILRENTTMLVQDKTSYDLAKELQIQNLEISGDPRIDSVLNNKEHFYKNKELVLKLANKRPIVIYGSVYKEDIDLIQTTIEKHPDKFHIIVPHDNSDSNINLFIKELKSNVLINNISHITKIDNILIVNTIGELIGLYSIAQYVYIGGGFTKNVHNTLEPAVYGLPIAIGPKHKGFLEIEYFKNNKLIKIVHKRSEFSEFLLILKKDKIRNIKKGMDNFFMDQAGSSKKIIHHIGNLIVLRQGKD